MRRFALPLFALFMAACASLFAQNSGIAQSGAATSSGGAQEKRYPEGTARIVLEDGSVPQTAPLIIAECIGAVQGCRCETHFFLGGTLRFRVIGDASAGEMLTSSGNCFVSVRLDGYQLVKTPVRDGVLIKLYRAGPNEDISVSAASMAVLAKAKKHYESGEAAAAKSRWPKAEAEFQAALAIYPKYALALSELGRVLRQQDRLNEAADALNRAREADPQYLKPVIQLAEVAGLQQRWADEIRLCQEALKMRPAANAITYYYYGQAIFHSGMLDEAERLAREAVKFASDSECPESMMLLGEIFEKKGNVSDAIVEYRAYLKVAPHGSDAKRAKEALARLKVG